MDDNGKNTIPWKDDAKSIKSVAVQNGVTSIGNCAFYECTNLVSATLPASIIRIGSRAFEGCINLSTFTIPQNIKYIGDYAFYGCWSLPAITIPEGVISIGDYAFCHCEAITSIEIPGDISVIGKSWFEQCYNLESVSIPNSVVQISDYAFFSCKKITSIELPQSIKIIGEYAFRGCESVESIEIPNGVTALNDQVFYACSSLASISIPESVTNIGKNAFYGCNSLVNMYFRSNPSMSSASIPSTAKRHLSVSDVVRFNNTNANTYADVTYERVLADGKYGTIIFPFAIDDDTKSNYEFYELDGQEGGRLNFTPVDDPQPGTPYLYKNAEGKKADCFTSGGRVTICTTMSDKDAGDGWTMKGNYESLVITDADELDVTYYLSNNKVMNATTSLTLKPFRAYFQGPSYAATFADAGVKSIAIRTGEGTTLVSPETMEEVPAVYYDLSGRAVTEPQSGIYIVNGKKLMVK